MSPVRSRSPAPRKLAVYRIPSKSVLPSHDERRFRCVRPGKPWLTGLGGRHRRNAEILPHAAGALALPEDQQPDGTADAGDPATSEGGGQLPGRPVGADAAGRPLTPCGRNQVGNQTLSEDGPAGRSCVHRLTALLLVPMGARSKNTSTQQPSYATRKIESAKNSGHNQCQQNRTLFKIGKQYTLCGSKIRQAKVLLCCKCRLVNVFVAHQAFAVYDFTHNSG